MLFIAKNKSSLEMLIRTRLGRFKESDLMGSLNQLTGQYLKRLHINKTGPINYIDKGMIK